MHSPLPSCTYRVEWQETDAGARVIKEESTVAEHQRAGKEEVTAFKQRHATTGNSSAGGHLDVICALRSTEYKLSCSFRTFSKVHIEK